MRSPIANTVTVLAIAACLTISLNLWAQDPPEAPDADPAPVVEKWQHLALPHDASEEWNTPELAKQINKLGREGWEMVTVLNFEKEGSTEKTIYYFKKPL